MFNEKEKKLLQYHFAKAILKQLWAAGLIAEEEMNRIDERNKKTFLSLCNGSLH